jgi:predicted GNAT family N-acyltransferase
MIVPARVHLRTCRAMGFSVRQPQDREELAAAVDLRTQVFRDEQGFHDYVEHDGRDESSLNLVAVEDGEVLGTCRVLFEDGVAKLGRLCVAVEHRRRGIGRAMVRECVAECARGGWPRMILNAQMPAHELYRSEGFEDASGIFIVAGIEHVRMERALDSASLLDDGDRDSEGTARDA